MRPTKNFEERESKPKLGKQKKRGCCLLFPVVFVELVASCFHAHVKIIGSRSTELIAGSRGLAFLHHGGNVSTVGQAVVGNHGHDHRAVCKSSAAALDLKIVIWNCIHGGSSGKSNSRRHVVVDGSEELLVGLEREDVDC